MDEKNELILCYFTILNDLYNWNFNTYDVVIRENYSKHLTRKLHDKILKNLILKEELDIPLIVDDLISKNLLTRQSNRYSGTGKTHYNDIIGIKNNII